ncbi:hypothetical protein LIER_17810 [Lithospermum erythrorhizon]|uniref:Uncharacterized protein n=1 Tax=Lithospermum erythrorhizon TaxID=34254 RepID=A0AAV3QBL6_LITER
MQLPSEYKDIQKLTGCLAALSRFISKSGKRNLPFFKNLRRASNTKFYWDDECNMAFEELKEYLGSPKLLLQPKSGEVLQLYLTVSEGAIRETLFNLVYGSEVVLPAEAGLPTYCQLGFIEEGNEQRMKEQLNFLDELCDQALYKMQKYKYLMAHTYNRRVKNKQFKVGDLVLRLFSITHPKDKDKLSPKWEGPYRVSKRIGPGTYELEKMNGDPIPRLWHPSNLTKYYV